MANLFKLLRRGGAPETPLERQRAKLVELGIGWWNRGKLINIAKAPNTNPALRLDRIKVWALNHGVKAEDVIRALEM